VHTEKTKEVSDMATSTSTTIGELAKAASEKQAFLMWGGAEAGLHPKGRGIGGALGYSNLLGLLPVPTGNIDIGGPKHGFQLGVAADPDSEFGVSPLIGARFNHPRKSGLTRQFPRGLPEVIYDKLRGRTKEDAIRASYPELFEEEEEAQPRDGDGDGKVNDGTEEETEVKELAKAAAHFAKRAYGTSDDHFEQDRHLSGMLGNDRAAMIAATKALVERAKSLQGNLKFTGDRFAEDDDDHYDENEALKRIAALKADESGDLLSGAGEGAPWFYNIKGREGAPLNWDALEKGQG